MYKVSIHFVAFCFKVSGIQFAFCLLILISFTDFTFFCISFDLFGVLRCKTTVEVRLQLSDVVFDGRYFCFCMKIGDPFISCFIENNSQEFVLQYLKFLKMGFCHASKRWTTICEYWSDG